MPHPHLLTPPPAPSSPTFVKQEIATLFAVIGRGLLSLKLRPRSKQFELRLVFQKPGRIDRDV